MWGEGLGKQKRKHDRALAKKPDLQAGKDSILSRAVSREVCIKNYKWENELYYSCLSANKNISSWAGNGAGLSKCNKRSVFFQP